MVGNSGDAPKDKLVWLVKTKTRLLFHARTLLPQSRVSDGHQPIHMPTYHKITSTHAPPFMHLDVLFFFLFFFFPPYPPKKTLQITASAMWKAQSPFITNWLPGGGIVENVTRENECSVYVGLRLVDDLVK